MQCVTFKTVAADPRTITVPEDVRLPEGEVEVTVRTVPAPPPLQEKDSQTPKRDWLLELVEEIERLNIELPSDLAENHDYYAHGKPRS